MDKKIIDRSDCKYLVNYNEKVKEIRQNKRT